MPNDMMPENHLTDGRRATIISVVKAKISKSKTKVRKNRDQFLKDALKALTKNPDKKAVAIGKVIKDKRAAADKLELETAKKITKITADHDKAVKAASSETKKKVDALYKELTKKTKALAKATGAKTGVIEKPAYKKIEALQNEVEKATDKLNGLGYNVDESGDKLVRPLFRTNKDSGKKELGGVLAEPIRDEARAKLEALDELADDSELTAHINGTSLDDQMAGIVEEADEIVNA